MLGEGIYKARASTWGLGKSGSGSEQLGVEFALTDPEVEGQRLTWYGYFTDKSFDITVRALRTCGWVGDDLSNLQGLDANEVQLVVEHEEYDGTTQVKVRWVNPIGGLAMKTPLLDDEAKSFAARMRGKVLAANQGASSPPPRKPAADSGRGKVGGVLSPEPPPHTEGPDGLPF